MTPDLRCHTCNAQPARRGPNAAPPTAAWSCHIHCTQMAAHSLPFGAPHSTPLPSACPHTLPPGSDHPHGPCTPPPSHPSSPHCQPCALTLPLSQAITTCDITCHRGGAVKRCRRLLGDDVFLSNAAYVRAPLHIPCGLTHPSRCSTPSATPSSTRHRTSSGPAPSGTQSVHPHLRVPAPY